MLMKKLIVALAAAGFLATASAPSQAAPAGTLYWGGPWIVGGVMVSAASLILCSHIVGVNKRREMTSHEAMFSAVVPLGCVLLPSTR